MSEMGERVASSLNSSGVFETTGAAYEGGWQDITCVFARFQEQYRRGDGGKSEFRHRRIHKVVNVGPDTDNVVYSLICARVDEPWLTGPSLDGSARNFLK